MPQPPALSDIYRWPLSRQSFYVSPIMPNLPLPPLHPEEWLAERFVHVAEFDPRFESSWYGLHIALLSHYFPYQQTFLVRPQPKIRDSYEEELSFSSIRAESSMMADSENSFVGDTSITSTGVLTLPGLSYHVPDFTVTKATQYTTHDRLLLLVEVKPREPNEARWTVHISQMDGYMEAASQHLEKGAGLVGLLICGTTVQVCRLASPGAQVTADKMTYELNSVAIRQLLHSISKDN